MRETTCHLRRKIWCLATLSHGYADWALVANPSSTDTAHAVVSFVNRADGQMQSAESDIAPGKTWYPNFPGKMGGPVEVKAYKKGGSWPADKMSVVASQRVLSGYGKGFNELPGVSDSGLKSDYLWTWYDMKSAGAKNWVLVANPPTNADGSKSAPIYFEIDVAGKPLVTGGPLGAGASVYPTFPGTMGGPLEVRTYSDKDHTVPARSIASQRSIWGPSFEEVPGTGTLAKSYNWTWYDMKSAGMQNCQCRLKTDPLAPIEN